MGSLLMEKAMRQSNAPEFPTSAQYGRMEIPRVSITSLSVRLLPRVLKIGHSGKRLFQVSIASPSAKNWALREEALPRVLHSGKNNTRGREAPVDEKWYLTAEMDGAIFETLFPECLPLAVGEASLFPECLILALGEASLFPECIALALGRGLLPEC
jgi:hypothetical protein